MAATSWTPKLGSRDGPIYLAIADALAADIASGQLAEGARLPTQRRLAEDLDIDFTTVSRAYGEARARGLIEGRVGQGTYVRSSRAAPPGCRTSGVVDMSMNLPPRFTDALLIQRMWDTVHGLRDSGLDLLMRYQEPGGAAPNRAAATGWLKRRIGGLSPERVLVAAGAQAAFHAILGSLASPGDVILTEALTYPGFRSAANHLRLRLVGVEMDALGLVPEALERAVSQHRPKALYCMPTLHNPTTRTIPLSRRREILEIARKSQLCIIEDDAYGSLTNSAPPPLASLAPELVYHVASLSKCLSPALRVAYLAVPEGRIAARVSSAIRAAASTVSPLSGAIATRWIEEGVADEIVAAIVREAAARTSVARRILPPQAELSTSGFHAWLNVTPPWSRGELVARLREVGVGVVASDSFAATNAPEAIRLGLGVPETVGDLQESLGIITDLLSQEPAGSTMVV